MTKLERRLAEVGDACGQIVSIGYRPHKQDWFAHCNSAEWGVIEWGGSTAAQALESVVASLREKAEGTVTTYRSQMVLAERLKSL